MHLKPYFGLYLLGLTAACGSTTLDPVQNGTGGASTGGSSSGGSSGSGGVAASGGSSASGGNGGGNGCASPNPVGCVQAGCSSGLICNTDVQACVPSSCGCDEDSGEWVCTDDCGGGVCTPDPKVGKHFVRIGFVDGQVKIPDFCVSYENDGLTYTWEQQPLLALHGEDASSLNGLKRLTKYLPLKAPPSAFAIASSKSGCAGPSYVAEMPIIDTLGLPPTHFALLSAPMSNEPPEVWVLPDSGPVGGGINSRLRVINATTTSYDLINVAADGDKLGKFPFGKLNSYFYQSVTKNHLQLLTFEDFGGKYSADFSGGDMLALHDSTVIVAGSKDNYHAFGCLDGKGLDFICLPATVKKLP